MPLWTSLNHQAVCSDLPTARSFLSIHRLLLQERELHHRVQGLTEDAQEGRHACRVGSCTPPVPVPAPGPSIALKEMRACSGQKHRSFMKSVGKLLGGMTYLDPKECIASEWAQASMYACVSTGNLLFRESFLNVTVSISICTCKSPLRFMQGEDKS